MNRDRMENGVKDNNNLTMIAYGTDKNEKENDEV
jgi:hypothetical protein